LDEAGCGCGVVGVLVGMMKLGKIEELALDFLGCGA
jgi:hypothetical protein